MEQQLMEMGKAENWLEGLHFGMRTYVHLHTHTHTHTHIASDNESVSSSF
jgi:hypothetical protein